MSLRGVAVVSFAAALVACATSSEVLTGARRAPILPAAVRVYTQAPESFEEIAVLHASRKSISSAGGERAIAKMIEEMRARAAGLGANGLLLEDFSDSAPFAVRNRSRVANLYAQRIDRRGHRREPRYRQENSRGASYFRSDRAAPDLVADYAGRRGTVVAGNIREGRPSV